MGKVEGFTNTQKIKEEAANWLLLIEQKSPLSKSESQALQEWVATSAVHRSVIIRMAKTWDNMDVLAIMRVSPDRKSRRLIDTIKIVFGGRVILDLLKIINKSKLSNQLLFFKLSSVSICLIVSLFLIGLSLSENPNSRSNSYVTMIGEYGKYTLDDGSTLWLNSNSQVKVNYSDNFRRISLIKGEAHFEVKKDATRPFEVYSQDRLVRAVGTAFSVHKLKDSVEVIVSEGVVELAIIDKELVLSPETLSPSDKAQHLKNKSEGEYTREGKKESAYLGQLTAGQSMSIPSVSFKQIEKQIGYVAKLEHGELSRKLAWLDGKLIFAGETLEEVVTEISRHTTIKIDVIDPELRKLRIGGHFRAGETDKLFTILESGFGIEVVKINENHVELLGKSKIKGKIIN